MNEVLNYFLFLYLKGSVHSPNTKRTQIWPGCVSLIEVKHEIKCKPMKKHLNISFTSFIPDFLLSQKIQEPNLCMYESF